MPLRHLLTHTGGWVGDYFSDFGNGDDALAINGNEGGIITAQTFGWALELCFGIKLKTPRPLAKPQELPEFVGRYRICTYH